MQSSGIRPLSFPVLPLAESQAEIGFNWVLSAAKRCTTAGSRDDSTGVKLLYAIKTLQSGGSGPDATEMS